MISQIIEAIERVKGAQRSNISRSTSLKDLGIDSLDALEIVHELEEELGVEIPDEIIADREFRTVGDIESAASQSLGISLD